MLPPLELNYRFAGNIEHIPSIFFRKEKVPREKRLHRTAQKIALKIEKEEKISSKNFLPIASLYH